MRFIVLIPLISACVHTGPLPGLRGRDADLPPITTVFEDADPHFPELDGFTPAAPIALGPRDRTPEGGLRLPVGAATYTARSFCLKHGTYAPDRTHGAGYVAAEIAGPKEWLVRAILQRYSQSPDAYDQRRVQELLWAIIARMDPAELRPELNATAARLLTADELARWSSDSAVRLASEGLQRAAWSLMPEPIAELARREARLRDLLRRAESTYEELEAVAVRTGAWPDERDVEAVPRGRWTLHRDGYFVSYDPEGYQRTQVTFYRPPPHRVERDASGRILRVSREDGWAVATTWADEPGRPHPEDPDLIGWRIASITLTPPAIDGRRPEPEARFSGSATVFFAARGALDVDKALPADKAAAHAAAGERWEGWDEAADRAVERSERLQQWLDREEDLGSEAAVDDLVDLDRYQDGLDVALAGSPEDKAEWIGEHLEALTAASMYVICALAGGCDAEEAAPYEDVAAPAAQSGQRLGQSSASFDE
jgi:hypothetical protein